MNYKKDLFSLITVVKNDENNIEKTIKSVINQKERNKIQYIIIDGNSTDKTKDIIKKYMNSIDIFTSEDDKGIYDAMNKGISLSNGEYIGFCNSGDTLYQNAIENINKTFKINKSDAVFGTVKRNYLGETIIKSKVDLDRINYNFDFATSHSTGFYVKKKIHDMIGLYDTKFRCSADYDFFYRLVKSNKFKISSTDSNAIIGEVAAGGFSSRLSFIEHLNEEFKIRLKNKQNLIFIILIYLNAMLKNLNKIFRK